MSELVTVFGGTGFVGTYLVRALARKGWRVRVAARRPKRGYRLPSFGDVGQIQLLGCDIASREQVDEALFGASAAINLVGVLSAQAGRSFRKVHVDGAETVAAAAAAKGIGRLVQMSAIGADPRSSSRYGRTKAEGEQAVRKILPAATIIRPSIVFGPEDDFFNRFARMATWSPALPLIGGGKTKFQPVYVGDVAQAITNALSSDAAPGKTFELGGPDVFTFKEVLEMVLRETQRRRLLVPMPFFAAELLGLGGDVGGLMVSGLLGLFGERAAMAAPTPMLTTDQVRMLRRDNVVSPKAAGLKALGVEPTAVESILPSYLWLYRKGGQFAEQTVR
jgi:NADH dehydrogenase